MINSVGSNSYSLSALSVGPRQRSQAPDASQTAEKMFSKVDTNGDGSIDKTEFATAIQNRGDSGKGQAVNADDLFSKIDSNGDGTVSKAENTDYLKQLQAQRKAGAPNGDGPPPPPPDSGQLASDVLSKIDSDSSGGISLDELTSAFQSSGSTNSSNSTSDIQQLFSKLDTDSDGNVSKDELSSGFQQALGDIQPPAFNTKTSSAVSGGQNGTAPSASTSSSSTGSGTTAASSNSTKTYDPADTNQDGKVSQAEQAAYERKLAAASPSQSGGAPVHHILQQLLHAYSDSPSTRGSLSVSA